MNPSDAPLDYYNCLDILIRAEKDRQADLKRSTLTFAYENFDKVCNDESFCRLDEKLLDEFLSGADLNAASQGKLFHNLVRWYRHNPDHRIEFMYNLIRKYIHLERLEGKPVAFEWNMPHKPIAAPKRIILVTSTSPDYTLDVREFSPKQNRWLLKSWPTIPYNHTGFSTFFYENKFFISGGYTDRKPTNIVQYLLFDSMEWYDLAPLGEKRCGHVMINFEGCLYVFGGRMDKRFCNAIEKYDFSTRKWQDIGAIPEGIKLGSTVEVSNGRIYFHWWENFHLDCYDPRTNSWTKTAPRTTRGKFIVLTNLNDHLYAIAGIPSTKPKPIRTALYTVMDQISVVRDLAVDRAAKIIIELYDSVTNIWTEITSFTDSLGLCTSVLKGRFLILCRPTICTTAFVEYLPQINKWTKLPPIEWHSYLTLKPYLIYN